MPPRLCRWHLVAPGSLQCTVWSGESETPWTSGRESRGHVCIVDQWCIFIFWWLGFWSWNHQVFWKWSLIQFYPIPQRVTRLNSNWLIIAWVGGSVAWLTPPSACLTHCFNEHHWKLAQSLCAVAIKVTSSRTIRGTLQPPSEVDFNLISSSCWLKLKRPVYLAHTGRFLPRQPLARWPTLNVYSGSRKGVNFLTICT